MRIISERTLILYWQREKKSQQPLRAWNKEIGNSKWKNHNELRTAFGTASIVSEKRVVFNIGGNKYRLIVDIEYKFQIVFIVWIGTHKQYDNIDAKTVKYVKAH